MHRASFVLRKNHQICKEGGEKANEIGKGKKEGKTSTSAKGGAGKKCGKLGNKSKKSR